MDDKLRKGLFAQVRRLEKENEILRLKLKTYTGEIPHEPKDKEQN